MYENIIFLGRYYNSKTSYRKKTQIVRAPNEVNNSCICTLVTKVYK